MEIIDSTKNLNEEIEIRLMGIKDGTPVTVTTKVLSVTTAHGSQGDKDTKFLDMIHRSWPPM